MKIQKVQLNNNYSQTAALSGAAVVLWFSLANNTGLCYTHRTGTSDIIFGYNGRDGVVTEVVEIKHKARVGGAGEGSEWLVNKIGSWLINLEE